MALRTSFFVCIWQLGLGAAIGAGSVTSAQGAPLTPEAILGVQKVGILIGTFDPITESHMAVARTARTDAGMDVVILLPSVDPKRKSPLSYEIRTELADLAAANDEKILVPVKGMLAIEYEIEGAKALVQSIRSVTPDVEIHALAGDDNAADLFSSMSSWVRLKPDGWIISNRPEVKTKKLSPFVKGVVQYIRSPLAERSYSSTWVREALADSPELYLERDAVPSASLAEAIPTAVLDRIRERGYYLGRGGNNRPGIKRYFENKIGRPFVPTQLVETFRYLRLKRVANLEPPPAVTVNGKVYPLIRYLGSGAKGDAFLVMGEEGENYVAKIPNQASDALETARREVLVKQWLAARTPIHVPTLLAFDPETSISISSFVRGKDIGAVLNEIEDYRGGQPGAAESIEKILGEGISEEDFNREIRKFFDAARELFQSTRMRLDIRSDNIKWSQGKVVLVDTGPVALLDMFPEDFFEVTRDWKIQARESWIPRTRRCIRETLFGIFRSVGQSPGRSSDGL